MRAASDHVVPPPGERYFRPRVATGFKSTLTISRTWRPMGEPYLEKYAKLLVVFRHCGRVHSRIKAQKLFYILKSLGYPVAEKFEYRNYGPYSEQLASELRSSVNSGFLSEERTEREEEWPDETLRYERYDYSIAPRGEEFLRAYLQRSPQLASMTEPMADVALGLNAYQPAQLELISTLMFLEDQPVRSDLIIPMLQSLKPQFTSKEIEDALGIIRRLRSSSSLGSQIKRALQ